MRIAIIMPLAEQRGGGELMLLHLMQHGQGLGVEWLVVFLAEGPMVQEVRALGAAMRAEPGVVQSADLVEAALPALRKP